MNYFSLNVRLQNQSMKTNSAEDAFLPQSQIVYKAITNYFMRLIIMKLRLFPVISDFFFIVHSKYTKLTL